MKHIKLFEEFTAVDKKNWNKITIHNFKPEKLYKQLSITDLRKWLPDTADTSRNAALNIEEVQGDSIIAFENINIGQFRTIRWASNKRFDRDEKIYRISEKHYILEDTNPFQGTNAPNITLLSIYVFDKGASDPYVFDKDAIDPYTSQGSDYTFLGSIYVDQKAYLKEMSEEFEIWPRNRPKYSFMGIKGIR